MFTELIETKFCNYCSKELSLKNFYIKKNGKLECICKACKVQYKKRWRHSSSKSNETNKKYQKLKVKNGLCISCGQSNANKFQHCDSCRETKKQKRLKNKSLGLCCHCGVLPKSVFGLRCTNCELKEAVWRIKIKYEVLAHYGDSCFCCGNKNIDVLTIDHIKNDGNIHRKQDKKTIALWSWLRQNNFPEGFQVLCHNCNWKKFISTKSKSNERYNKIRKDIFNHYGNFCVDCGCSDFDLLSIDHINNDGKKEKIGSKNNFFYTKLIYNNFPTGLQTLCRNCNWKKEIILSRSWIYSLNFEI